MGDKPKLKKGVYQNPNSERSKESIDRYVRGMRDKKYGGKRINTDRIRKFSKGMTPGQAKLAAKAPPPNKIDAKDFAVLRAEKAKGRGMGLQDEKVQPGKVMKAKKGKSIFAGYSKAFEGARDNRRVATIVGVKPNAKIKGSGRSSRGSSKINATNLKAALMKSKNAYSDLVKTTAKGTKRYSSMAEMREAKGFKPGESASDFNKRRMKLDGAKVLKSAGTRGKIALAVGAAGVGALEYLKSKMNKKKDVKKKMGGGMMKKPMGYVKGGGMDMGGPKGKLMSYVKENYMSDKDRLTNRDTEMVKAVKNIKKSDYPAAERYYKKLTSTKKMGGGMMKKYSKGGGSDMGAKRDFDKITERTKTYAKAESMKDRDRLTTRDIQEATKALKPSQRKSRRYAATPGYLPKPAIGKMGGGMMQKPMGYSKGVSVKARGCKLGRTRPTKIT